MKHQYSSIINVLILVLIVVLVCVMFNYYANGKIEVSSPKTPINSQPTVTPTVQKEVITPIVEPTKEPSMWQENELVAEPTVNEMPKDETSGEGIHTVVIPSAPQSDSNESNGITQLVVTPTKEVQSSSPVIITSETETSSKEKREILGELDKTLMELLDVVDKVKIVDESRLPSDSEVGL